MRRRLLVTYVTLLAAMLAGLCVPFAVVVAARDTQAMFIDRQGDTARFASLAEPALRTGQTTLLAAEMAQYDEAFDIATVIVGRDGRPILASRPGLDVTDDAAVRDQLDTALSGTRAASADVSWPWSDDPLIVAEPVRGGGEITGAALIVAPTAALHRAIWRSWLLLAGVGLAFLLIGAIAAAPLARWMLRPVHDLDEAAHALAEGRFGDRVPVESGPVELRRLIVSFNTMSERIGTLVARQRSFVSYASHQLRTPLATLQLCVENLRPSVRPDGLEDYAVVGEEIDRMGRLCNALLTYARAEATADEVSDVDAAAVADARMAIWGRAATLAGIRFARTGADGVPARVAVQALDQALDALLSNAVKFAGAGADVVVDVERAGDEWVDIHVMDTGPGIPPEDIERAAEAFWRRTADQNVEGSGLGVTIADALVNASGGRLDLMPARPHGLHARIRLRAAT